jgi:hypothetical protein
MTTIINASSSAGLVQTADTSAILQLQTASTAALTITAAQNVGVGTASPATKLQVSGLTGANGLSIAARTDVADNSGNLFFTDSGGTVCIKSATGAMLFNTGATVGSGSGTERMRIDSAGNVGIDTTPAYRLQVRRAGGAGSLGVSIDTIVGSVRDVQYYAVPDSGTGTSAHTFYVRNGSTADSRVLRISQDGTLTLRDGDTSATGVGITFPATQISSANANTLDDYEEGTFTPTLNFSGSSTGITYGSQIGRYTKIGNMVSVFCSIGLTNKGSAAGTVGIAGIPFTCVSSGNAISGIYGTLTSISSQLIPYVSGTNITVEQINTGTQSGLLNTQVTNTSSFYFSMTYQTNT